MHENTLYLAENFNPDVDFILEAGIACFGIKGSGKSSLLARLVEQFSRFLFPQIVFDIENEFHTLLPFLPHGVLADRSGIPSAHDILHHGLQVIVNLASFETSEQAGMAIVALVEDLFYEAGKIAPADRVPVALHLDEAGYWLPQKAVNYLPPAVRKGLLEQFNRLGSRGRKYGLNVFLYAQFISQIDKDTIRNCAIHALMRQSQDIDLDRYCDGYLRHLSSSERAAKREEISQFAPGMAILHGIAGKPTVQFHEQQSEHVSHTPRVKAAIARFANTAINYDQLQTVSYSAAPKVKPAKPEPKEFYTLAECLALLECSRAQFYILAGRLQVKPDHHEGRTNFFAASEVARMMQTANV